MSQNAPDAIPGTPFPPPATNAFLAYEHVLQYDLPQESLLGDDNWGSWKTHILGFLELVELDKYPLGEMPKPDEQREPREYAKWQTEDRVVAHLVLNSIDSGQVERVLACRDTKKGREPLTSAEIWEALQDAHEADVHWKLAMTFRKLFSATGATARLAAIEQLQMAIVDMECAMEDKTFNFIAAASMPAAWASWTIPLLERDGKIPKSQFIAKLKAKNAEMGESAVSVRRPNKRRRGNGLCSICRYDNHVTDDCRWKREGGYCIVCKRGGHWTKRCADN